MKFKYRTVLSSTSASRSTMDELLCKAGADGFELDKCVQFDGGAVLFVFKREFTDGEYRQAHNSSF